MIARHTLYRYSPWLCFSRWRIALPSECGVRVPHTEDCTLPAHWIPHKGHTHCGPRKETYLPGMRCDWYNPLYISLGWATPL